MESMADVLSRLRKIGGQLQGLSRMIEADEPCEKVLTQFQAARAALDATYGIVLERNLRRCLNRQEPESVEKILKLIAKK